METVEETIEAELDVHGRLQLSHRPRLPPGPVRVTIRPAPGAGLRLGLADVVRAIAADQRARRFPGRSAADVQAEDDARGAEDDARDQELEAARRPGPAGGAR